MSKALKYNARNDANEKDCINTFTKLGWTVYRIKKPVDLVVGQWGINFLVEIKNDMSGKKPKKYTPFQEGFFKDWKGEIYRIGSIDEVLEFDIKMRNKYHLSNDVKQVS